MGKNLSILIISMLVFSNIFFVLSDDNNVKANPDLITISGRWRYYDNSMVPRDIRFASVAVYDDQPLVSRKIGEDYTDNNGYYSIDVEMDEGDGLDIWVEVYTECMPNDERGVYVYYEIANIGHKYKSSTPIKSPVFTSTDMGTYTINSDTKGAWNILNQSYMAYEKLRDLPIYDNDDDLDSDGSTYDSWNQPTIGIKWPTDPPSRFFDLYYMINLKKGSEWNRDTIQHEYSHAVMWKLFGEKWPIGSYISEHAFNLETNEHTALIEGWASFLPCILQKNDDYNTVHVETANHYTIRDDQSKSWNGNKIEGAVLNILYDISDDSSFTDLSPGKDDDGISGGFSKVWNIMREYTPDALDEYSDSTNDFWDAWFNAGYGYKNEMNAIYWEHGIQKNKPPIRFFISPYVGGWYSGEVPISFWAGDLDGIITKIEFSYSTDRLHWHDIGTVKPPITSNMSINWDTETLTTAGVWLSMGIEDGYKWDGKTKTMGYYYRVLGPFGVDNKPPGKPSISSPSHKKNVWVNNDDITFTWDKVTDSHSGMYKYRYTLDHNPDTEPLYPILGKDITSLTINNVADGDDWYFHLRAEDYVGNRGETDHYGPIKIKTYHYIYPYIYNDGPSQKVYIKVDGKQYGPETAPANAYFYFSSLYLEEGYYDFEVYGQDFGECSNNNIFCYYDDQKVYVGKLVLPSYFIYAYVYNDGPAQNIHLKVDGHEYEAEWVEADSRFDFPSVLLKQGRHDFEVYGEDFGYCSQKNVYIDESEELDIGDLEQPPIYLIYTYVNNNGPAQYVYLKVDGDVFGPEFVQAYSEEFSFPSVPLEEGSHDFVAYGADYGYCSKNNVKCYETGQNVEIGVLE